MLDRKCEFQIANEIETNEQSNNIEGNESIEWIPSQQNEINTYETNWNFSLLHLLCVTIYQKMSQKDQTKRRHILQDTIQEIPLIQYKS